MKKFFKKHFVGIGTGVAAVLILLDVMAIVMAIVSMIFYWTAALNIFVILIIVTTIAAILWLAVFNLLLLVW